MKYFTLILWVVCLSTQAQDVELRWAEKIETKEKVTILGVSKEQYYTAHRNDDKNLVCRMYDRKMNLKSEKVVNFDVDFEKYSYKGAYFANEKIIHFLTNYNRKSKKHVLLAGTTNLDLETSKDVLLLDEANEKVSYFGSKSISPDSTKIVVYNQLVGKRNEPRILHFKVYDTNLNNKLLEKTVELPLKAKNFNMVEIGVDNLSNVYALAKVIKEKNEKGKNESRHYYKLIVFNNNDEITEFDYDYPERDIESISIVPGKNNTLAVTGFLKILNSGLFGKGKKALISDEMFTSIIDSKTLSLKSANKYELEGLYPEKPKKASDYVPYKVKEIFYKDDGGAVVVAEQFKIETIATRGANGIINYHYLYYYCDIAIIHINNKAEVESVSKMPKYHLNAENPSIIATYSKGTIYIVYEDLEKNADAKNDKETKRSTATWLNSTKRNALFLLSVSPSGEMKKDIIYSYKDGEIRPRTLSSRVVSENEILLNADDQIGLLKIKN